MSKTTGNHIEKIFKSEPFLTVDLIISYLDNTLTLENKHKVEKALIDDLFLMEAIAGLEGMPSEERKIILYDLLGKEQKETIIIPYKLIGIAAATFIGVLSVFLITRTMLAPTEETIAFKDVVDDKQRVGDQVNQNNNANELVKKEGVNTEPKIVTVEETQEIEEEVKENSIKEGVQNAKPLTILMPQKTIIVDSAQTRKLATQTDEKETSISNAESDGTKLKVKEVKPPKKTPQELALHMIQSLKKKPFSRTYNSNDSTQQSITNKTTSELTKKEANALENYALGVAAFNKGDYNESQKKLEAAFKKNNEVGEVRFFLAASYLCGSNNIDKAKKVFQLENLQELTQEKQWIQVIINLNEGKLDESKPYLEKIAVSNSTFKQEADSIIQALE